MVAGKLLENEVIYMLLGGNKLCWTSQYKYLSNEMLLEGRASAWQENKSRSQYSVFIIPWQLPMKVLVVIDVCIKVAFLLAGGIAKGVLPSDAPRMPMMYYGEVNTQCFMMPRPYELEIGTIYPAEKRHRRHQHAEIFTRHQYCPYGKLYEAWWKK